VPPALAIPVDVDDVTAEWISGVTGFDVAATEVLDRHSGTTGRARIALSYGGSDDGALPPSVFVKLPPFDERQREFVARTGLGSAEARFYRDLAAAIEDLDSLGLLEEQLS
jgi:hypothetical protein